jgi:hypothetical protein
VRQSLSFVHVVFFNAVEGLMHTGAPVVVTEQTHDSIDKLQPRSVPLLLSEPASVQNGKPGGRLAAAAAIGTIAEAITGVAIAATPIRPAFRNSSRRVGASTSSMRSTSKCADTS